MIIRNLLNKDIELHSFEIYRNDEIIKKKYFEWLEDLNVTSLISSEELIMPKRFDFVESSFDRFTQKNCIGFYIKYNPDDKLVGTLKLDSISFYKRSAWDGVMIGEKEYQGMGIAYAAYQIILCYGFSILGLRKINGGCNENNQAMIKIFKKIGYQKEGTLRQVDYINGRYSDHLLFGILRGEFFKCNKIELGY